MTNDEFSKLFNIGVRKTNSNIDQKYMDIAASIQLVLEEIILKMVKNLKKEFNEKNLCLAGGVALNCVANGKIYKEKIFKNIWIQPASGDAGGALGSALGLYYDKLNHERLASKTDRMNHCYLGPKFTNEKNPK